MQEAEGQTGGVTGMLFALNGGMLVTSSSEGHLVFQDLHPGVPTQPTSLKHMAMPNPNPRPAPWCARPAYFIKAHGLAWFRVAKHYNPTCSLLPAWLICDCHGHTNLADILLSECNYCGIGRSLILGPSCLPFQMATLTHMNRAEFMGRDSLVMSLKFLSLGIHVRLIVTLVLHPSSRGCS
jgi:hypothetical protein